jgi:hypothetical protein
MHTRTSLTYLMSGGLEPLPEWMDGAEHAHQILGPHDKNCVLPHDGMDCAAHEHWITQPDGMDSAAHAH